MLQLIDVKKTYLQNSENEVHALRGVTLNFREKEFVSILGQSGCGKTTLLNLIGGLDRATEGELIIDGVSTKQFSSSDWDTYRNEKIGFVFQNYNLIPHLNILTNVELSLTISGVGAAERTERAKAALEAVGLEGQMKKLPSQISGGQAQRVAIARAIVNDPAILLADEPTGAIDSETSKQVMELLKSISSDRLVIMVTHNIELAQKYSTRIISVLDGQVVGDTDPYYPLGEGEACANENEAQTTENEVDISSKDDEQPVVSSEDVISEASAISDEGNGEEEIAAEAPAEANADGGKRRKSKAKMPFFTAVKLSLRNLLNKLGRSFITALAGSIGIICIAVILAVNNGFSIYIEQFEKQSMSKYPITVSVSNEAGMAAMYAFLASAGGGLDDIDITSIFDIIDDGNKDNDRFPDEEIVRIYSQLGGMLSQFLGGDNKTKDISAFKRYVDSNFDPKYADVKYDYGLTLNIYAKNVTTDDETGVEQVNYTQISPLSESDFVTTMMSTLMQGAGGGPELDAMVEQVNRLFEQFAFWDELIGDDETITTQYDILAGHLPTNENEVVLVINDYNQISDFYALALNELGLQQFITAALNPSVLTQYDRTFDELLAEGAGEFYVLPTGATYEYNESTKLYTNIKDTSSDPFNIFKLRSAIEKSAIPVKISGILRVKPGMSGCINGVIGYSSALGAHIIEEANNCDFVKAQQAIYNEYIDALAVIAELAPYMTGGNTLTPEQQAAFTQALTKRLTNLTTGEEFTVEEYATLMSYINSRDLDRPNRIYFYANSVGYKDYISDFIADFNYDALMDETEREKRGEEVTETHVVDVSDDLDATVTELHSTVTLITYVLIGIALVSVLVTMFLIAIIMSISVQDRTREIGILRAMGARKLDIANIFNVETAILGLLAGLIGVLIAYVLQFPGNLLLQNVLGIGGVMQMAWWHPLALTVGSVLLTVIAGFIPAISAARKDPVIALRSE